MSYFIHAETNAFLTTFLAAGPYYLGLYTTNADRDGANGVEVSVAEYARQPVTFGTVANSLVANTATVTFPTPSTDGGYGEITGMGLFLSSDPGVAPTPRAVLEPPGDSFTMPVGFVRTFPADYISIEFRE